MWHVGVPCVRAQVTLTIQPVARVVLSEDGREEWSHCQPLPAVDHSEHDHAVVAALLGCLRVRVDTFDDACHHGTAGGSD